MKSLFKYLFISLILWGEGLSAVPVASGCIYAGNQYAEGAIVVLADGMRLKCSLQPTVVMDDGQVQLFWIAL